MNIDLAKVQDPTTVAKRLKTTRKRVRALAAESGIGTRVGDSFAFSGSDVAKLRARIKKQREATPTGRRPVVRACPICSKELTAREMHKHVRTCPKCGQPVHRGDFTHKSTCSAQA